ncbi:MAG: hypothetical protein H6742_07760 [Alphaproteobacteria bacterium]|nr:hypothetical protein [Alphaproteobacteria bacterium]
MSAMWDQFRRLLLGTVVEHLLSEGVQVDFSSIAIAFHDESEFRVPRLNNYMRFKGDLRATLSSPAPAGAQDRLARAMKTAWPELLKVVDIPIGDRLTPERNHITVALTDSSLKVDFDLVAD